jgi:hypothetical protein
MLIICDHRAPSEAIEKLHKMGKVVLFNSKLLAPMPLHGHPDIFICQTPETLIVAPNIQKELLNQLETSSIPYVFGDLPIEPEHPFTARYNAVVTNKVTICNPNTVDPKILELSSYNKLIQVKQSYNRCSTIALSDESFLTSDAKTHQQLLKSGFESLLIDPKTITLNGYSHGLFGGCAGICKSSNTLYTMGSLQSLPNYSEIIALIHKSGLSVCCLTDAPLQDVGGIIFL